MARLAHILESLPRSQVKAKTDAYIHVVVKSRLLGFVDDVEVLLDEDDKKIHFRSCSRLGHSDLGVNRRRIEAIKAKLGHQ